MTPTMISAGAVTAFVMAESRIGEMNTDSANRTPAVTAVRPVRPPTPTPEVDSTKLVTVEVPKTAPKTVPIAHKLLLDAKQFLFEVQHQLLNLIQ